MTQQKREIFLIPKSFFLIYSIAGLIVLSVGIWLTNDLLTSRSYIINERSALALQTSNFLSQWYGTTIMATDYVLRDVTTRVSVEELDTAAKNPEIQKRLSLLAREKLATLPGVTGLGLLDSRSVFVGSADESILGITSNSRLNVPPGTILEDRLYVEYVPASKSANKQPAILVTRPILSSEGYLKGGALAAIMVRSAQDWITTFTIGKHDILVLVDGDENLLASNPPRPDAIGKPLKSPAGQPRFGEQRSSASFIGVSPLDGRTRIYGVSKVEKIPLSIVVGYDQTDILQEWQRRVWQSAAGFLTLVFMLGLVLSKHLEALRQRDEMQKLAVTDALTGVANRRQLIASGELEIGKAIRYSYPMSVLMVDIDRFKSINDTWGHATGDRVIQSLADAMVANVRSTDLVGRLGGEEFAIVLTGTGPDGACNLANRLREYIEESVTVLSENGSQVRYTISIGVACLREGATTFDEILGRADKAMYEAKESGRNKVVLVQG